MSNVRSTVETITDANPGRFNHPGDALIYLLSGIHSSYIWENGEVVDLHADMFHPNLNPQLQVDDIAFDVKDIDIYSIHPATPEALILNIPDNITDDWNNAVTNVKNVLQTVGWKF